MGSGSTDGNPSIMKDDNNNVTDMDPHLDDTTVEEQVAVEEGRMTDNVPPSVTFSFFVYWVLPIFTLAFVSRLHTDVDMAPKPIFPGDHNRKHQRISIDFDTNTNTNNNKNSNNQPTRSNSATKMKMKMRMDGTGTTAKKNPTKIATTSTTGSSRKTRRSAAVPAPSTVPTYHPEAPTNYKQIVDTINQRRIKIPGASPTNTASTGTSTSTTTSATTSTTRSTTTTTTTTPKTTTNKPPTETKTANRKGSPPTKQRQDQQREQRQRQQRQQRQQHESRERGFGASSDPVRIRLNEQIDDLRDIYEDDPNDVMNAINLADALRRYDMQYHDGGTKQPEALKMYDFAITKMMEKKQNMIQNNDPTNFGNVPQEVTFHDYSQKSVDGTLCALYCAQGKVYFMANMFEKAVELYKKCLDIEPLYLDALNARGSTLIILGRYNQAAEDLLATIQHDNQYMFTDAFTGLGRVLAAKEDAIETGWEIPIGKLNEILPKIEHMKENSVSQNAGVMNVLYTTLNRLHHVMFTYHDVKTKDRELAWHHLTESYENKMKTLPQWKKGFEKQKITQTMSIFKHGFWPLDVGSSSRVPIFIIGFVRSGSTLLERVLDAHPDIVGTGEDSVFNGRLDDIRNRIVETSMTMDNNLLIDVVDEMANNVVNEMRERWKVIDANTEKDHEQADSDDKDEKEQITVKKQQMEKRMPTRMVDKMLNNYYNVGFIHMLFPNALILHVVREPMDTCFSAYKHEFPAGMLDYTSDFNVLAELYHSYRDLMDHWDRELPGRIMHIRYEDMVNDMSGVAKSIIDATGLKWYDDILNFHTKKQAVNTLSTTQVRKGVYKHSIHSWKKYEQELQPLVKLLGPRVSYSQIQTNLPGYTKPSTQTI